MPRTPTLTYQSPFEAIGASLGKALLGDPDTAAKKQQARTEAALTEARTRQAYRRRVTATAAPPAGPIKRRWRLSCPS